MINNDLIEAVIAFLILVIIIVAFIFPIIIVIELATALGTLLTAIVAFYSIGEAPKQRRAAYQPNISLKAANPFQVIWEYDQNMIGGWSATSFKYSHRFWDEVKSDDRQKQTYLVANNVGLGAAKSVSFSWSFDIKAMVDIIQPICDVQIELTNAGIFLKYQPMPAFRSVHPLEFRGSTNDILPVQINPKPVLIPVNSVYCYLMAIFYFYCLENGFNPADIAGKIPALNLTLSYEDIGNEQCQYDFKFRFGIPVSYELKNKEDPTKNMRAMSGFIYLLKE